MNHRGADIALAVVLLASLLAAPAHGAARGIDAACYDDMPSLVADVSEANVHSGAVNCVAAWGIVQGTSPGLYSPEQAVTRAQMATFITRTIVNSGGDLDPFAADAFDDDDGDPHERTINALAAAGIVSGVRDRAYAPGTLVSRAQMATFLTRAFEYRAEMPLPEGADAYDDDGSSAHEPSINKAAEAGFAAGVSATEFNPEGAVRRDAMASFVARVLDKIVLEGYAVAPPTGPPMPPTEGDTTTPPPPSPGGDQGAPPPPPTGGDDGLPPPLPGDAVVDTASTGTYSAAAIRVDSAGTFTCQGVTDPSVVQLPSIASSGNVAIIANWVWTTANGQVFHEWGQWLWSYRGSQWQHFHSGVFTAPPRYNGNVALRYRIYDYDAGQYWNSSWAVTAPNILGHGGGQYWCFFNGWGLIGAGI